MKQDKFFVPVIDFKNISSYGELGVFICMCRHANFKTKETFVSHQTLATELGISRKTVLESIEKLVSKRLIVLEIKKLRGKLNIYRVIFPTDETTTDRQSAEHIPSTPSETSQNSSRQPARAAANVMPNPEKRLEPTQPPQPAAGFNIDAFEEFWSIYPENKQGMKIGKEICRKWCEKNLKDSDWKDLFIATKRYSGETKQDFIANPINFLRSKNDETVEIWKGWINSDLPKSREGENMKMGEYVRKLSNEELYPLSGVDFERTSAEIEANRKKFSDFFKKMGWKGKTL